MEWDSTLGRTALIWLKILGGFLWMPFDMTVNWSTNIQTLDCSLSTTTKRKKTHKIAHAERQKREMDAMMTLLRKEENLIYNIFPLSAKRDEHRLMNSAHIGVEVR